MIVSSDESDPSSELSFSSGGPKINEINVSIS